MQDLQKEIIRYKRDDGVDLTATLYLPPGYDPAVEGPLPCLFWAYPREYKSKVCAEEPLLRLAWPHCSPLRHMLVNT